jgi:hypothetical protein
LTSCAGRKIVFGVVLDEGDALDDSGLSLSLSGPFRPVQSRRPELAKFGKSSEGGKLNPTPPTTKISMGIDESQQIRTFSFTTTLCNLLNSNNLNISIDLVSIRLCRLQRLSPKPFKLP